MFSMFVSAKLASSTTGYAGFEACGEGVLATAVKQEPLERGDPCPTRFKSGFSFLKEGEDVKP